MPEGMENGWLTLSQRARFNRGERVGRRCLLVLEVSKALRVVSCSWDVLVVVGVVVCRATFAGIWSFWHGWSCEHPWLSLV